MTDPRDYRIEQPSECWSQVKAGTLIRSHSVVYQDCKLGARLHIGHGVLIREDNIIGDDVSIGSHTVLEPNNIIGDRVRIHSNCFLSRVYLEDDVWVGPNAVFTDDLHPPCPRYAECGKGAHVKPHAVIGANCTILPEVTIGRGAVVGAGSVVTRDILPWQVVAGNPAKVINNVVGLKCPKGFFKHPYEDIYKKGGQK